MIRKNLLIVTLLSLVACQPSVNTEQRVPLTSKEKTENFDKCVDDKCATVDLSYPEFEGDVNLVNIINRQITEQNLQMWVNDDQLYENMEDAVVPFFKEYEDFRTKFPDAPQEWTFETTARVTHQTDSLISIRFENFSYLGGAHPNTVVSYLNLDLSKEGEILIHEKMLIDREKLLELAEGKFRKHYDVEPGIRLEDDGRFFLEDGDFFLPPTMGYEGNEFVLFYNSYEIGPYVMGRTELRFPLEELEGVVFSSE